MRYQRTVQRQRMGSEIRKENENRTDPSEGDLYLSFFDCKDLTGEDEKVVYIPTLKQTNQKYLKPGESMTCQKLVGIKNPGGFILEEMKYTDDQHGGRAWFYPFVYEEQRWETSALCSGRIV